MHILSENKRTARSRFQNPEDSLIDLLIRFVILASELTHVDVIGVDWQLIFLNDIQYR